MRKQSLLAVTTVLNQMNVMRQNVNHSAVAAINKARRLPIFHGPEKLLYKDSGLFFYPDLRIILGDLWNIRM